MAFDATPVLPATIAPVLSDNQKIVLRAIEIISDESRWITNADACNEYGEPISPRSKFAVAFCGRGAVYRAAYELGYTRFRAWPILKAMHDLPTINDLHGRESVIRKMERYIHA